MKYIKNLSMKMSRSNYWEACWVGYSGFLPRDALSAKRCIAIISRPSVCLSICPSATLRYRGRIGWTSSKLITRVISLGFRTSEPQRGNLVQGEPPKVGWNRGGVAGLSRKPAVSETGQVSKEVSKNNLYSARVTCRLEWIGSADGAELSYVGYARVNR